MAELTKEEKITIMFDRYNKMSKRETNFYNATAYYVDNLLQSACLYKKEHGTDETFDNRVDYFWDYSILGSQYEVFENDKQENMAKRISAVDNVIKRKRWGTIYGQGDFLSAVKDNDVTPLIFAMFARRFSQDDRNIFGTYMNDPLFSVGQIVQLRSNVGVDSVLTSYDYRHTGRTYYGSSPSELAKAKKKTFMVIGVDPEIDGTVYAKAYKYKDGQGGCRYYKLLPMGEQTTYYVVEKFMKKCRTKAVKDARK